MQWLTDPGLHQVSLPVELQVLGGVAQPLSPPASGRLQLTQLLLQPSHPTADSLRLEVTLGPGGGQTAIAA